MKLQKEPDPSIPTASGGTIRLRNLRPGDWLIDSWGDRGVVLQNSAVMERYETWVERYGEAFVTPYCIEHPRTYLGRGQKRKWWDRLPRFLRTHVSPYSKP
jgi:hypothetical protein